MVPHPLFQRARVLVLAVLLGMSVASAAQSTDSNPDTDPESGGSWSSDLKAPLRRPADDVGGSWNWVLLYGRMTDASLVDDVALNFAWDHSKLCSAEIGYTLKEDNPFVRFMDPVLSTVDVAMNITYQDDPAGTIFLFNPYIMARWSKFPWSNTIRTTFGLGGGLSYATDIPRIEIDPNDPNGN